MSRFRTNDPGALATDLERNVPQKPVVVDFTLTANAATSTLSNNALRPTSSVVPVAQTANAAAEAGGTALVVAIPTLGAVVISHANNAQTDRTFRVTIINP